jgi:hypothetical protein
MLTHLPDDTNQVVKRSYYKIKNAPEKGQGVSGEGVGTEMERNDKTCVGLDSKISEELMVFLAALEGSKIMNSSTKQTFPFPSTLSLPMSTTARTSTYSNFRSHKHICRECAHNLP